MWTAFELPGGRPGEAARGRGRRRRGPAGSARERFPARSATAGSAPAEGSRASRARPSPSWRAPGRAPRSAPATACASAAARRSSRIGSPIPNTRLAAIVVASSPPVRPARAGQVQRVGTQLVQPQPAEGDEQFVAPGAAEPGQREALEQPLEAALRRPRHVAAEGGRLRLLLAAGALGPLAVGDQRRGAAAAARARCAARAGRPVEVGRVAARAAGAADEHPRIPANGSAPSSPGSAGER